MEELYTKYLPIVYLHSNEQYQPVQVSNYIKNCRLVKETTDNVVMETISNPDDILKYDNKYYLELKDVKSRKGDKDKKQYFYCFSNKGNDNFNGSFIDLTYVLCYSYNGTLSPHDFDTESVTIRLDKNKKILKIVLTSHGNYVTYNPNQIEFEGHRPVVYSAWESHAFYPKPENYRRMFNFGNDVCERGIRLDDIGVFSLPNDPRLLPQEFKHLSFNGKRAKGFNERFPSMEGYKLDTNNFRCPKHTLQKLSEIYDKIFIYLIILLVLLSVLNLYFRINLVSLIIGIIIGFHLIFGLNRI